MDGGFDSGGMYGGGYAGGAGEGGFVNNHSPPQTSQPTGGSVRAHMQRLGAAAGDDAQPLPQTRRDQQTLVPVTIRQIQSAVPQPEGNAFVVDGKQLFNVRAAVSGSGPGGTRGALAGRLTGFCFRALSRVR